MISFCFEDNNVYRVPRKDVLKFYDIYHWQVISIDVHSSRIVLDKSVEDKLTGDLENYLGSNHRRGKNSYGKRYEKNLQSFFNRVEHEELDEKGREAESVPISFWAYITDRPAESFKRRHYSSHPPQTPDDSNWITVGVKFLDSLERNEETGWDGKTYPGKLKLSSDGMASRQLGEEELLPILGEYCGYFGRSKKGNIINYTYIGEVADESMCATPLYRNGSNTYHTLYFVSPSRHIDYPVNPHPRELEGITLNLYGEERANTLHLLEEEGFRIISSLKSKAYALSREGDVIHYYPSPKDCEPFLISVCHQGSYHPRERGELITDIGKKCFNRSQSKFPNLGGVAVTELLK